MISVFEPEVEHYPGTAIVMSNQYSGSVERAFGLEASEIANLTGALVLAYDRAGTGNRTVFSLALRKQLAPSRVIQRVAQTGHAVQNKLDSYGASRVITYGHSAAAPEAIALTRSETLNRVVGLGMSEPVAVRQMHPVSGFVRHATYNYFHDRPDDKPKKAEEEQTDTLEPSRLNKVGSAVLEILYYSALWPTTFTVESMRYIATEMPDVAVYAAFAGRSLSGDEEYIKDLVDRLGRFRHLTYNRPMRAEVLPGTLHSHLARPESVKRIVHMTMQLAGIEVI